MGEEEVEEGELLEELQVNMAIANSLPPHTMVVHEKEIGVGSSSVLGVQEPASGVLEPGLSEHGATGVVTGTKGRVLESTEFIRNTGERRLYRNSGSGKGGLGAGLGATKGF